MNLVIRTALTLRGFSSLPLRQIEELPDPLLRLMNLDLKVPGCGDMEDAQALGIEEAPGHPRLERIRAVPEMESSTCRKSDRDASSLKIS